MTVLDPGDPETRADVLPALPSRPRQLWSLLRTLTRRGARDAVIPTLSVEMPALRADPGRLAAYRALCGFGGAGLPVTFPQVQAAALQVHLLTRPEFPLPLLGMVLVRNTIRQLRPLEPTKDYEVRVDLLGGHPVPAGVEFAMSTRYSDRGALVWESVSIGLWRDPNRPRGQKRPGAVQDPIAGLEPSATFDAPTDIGRRYGRISGDMNPIHLYRLAGRLFGLPGHVAHGMWAVARCITLLHDHLQGPLLEIAVEVKQPMLLPSRLSLLSANRSGAVEFAVTSHDRERLHLLGSIRAIHGPTLPSLI